MFLAFDDDFLSTIDELVTALRGEVLVRQKGLGTIKFIANAVLVLLGDPVGQAIL